MDSSNMLEAALSYARLGWQVLPCRPGVKAPLTAHGCRDATTDEETIKAWWTRWPTANVAIACGAGSGVYVVDIDLDPAKNVDGWKSLEEFPGLPVTVRQDTPRGGAHFLFQTDTPPKNKNGFRNGIDIRSTGYYIMVPPSLHPNGKRYAWAPGLGPGEVELAEFPDYMRPPERPRLPWERRKPTAPAPTKPINTGDVVERARAYLLECEPAVQGQAGHDKLLWAARALVVGFELDAGTAINMLWDDFNPRCVPPWDRSNLAECKDFERKVHEVEKTPGEKPRGWLLEENGLRLSEALLAYGRQLQADLLAASATVDPSPAPSGEQAEKTPVVLSRPRFNPPPSAFPEWILNPPGLVGQFCQHINQTAGCYQPLLALGASITACGAMMGRKVRDQSNGRTNIYMMGVAHSSAGKDHPADCIEQIFATAGASNILGGSRVTSDSAIEIALEACPVQLFHWDEVGHMFAAIKQAGVGSGGAQHLRTIVPALMQLYSSAHKIYVGKQKAMDTVRRIDQPHVCVWGLTSPDVLYSGLSTAELRDGWLGRVITLISHDRPKYLIKNTVPPPDNLIQLTQAWVQRMIPAPPGMGDILGATSCHQITIPTNGAAMSVFNDFRDDCYKRMLQCDKDSDMTQYLWGKGLQNARRIALIVAAGCAFDGAEIQEFHAKYSCEMIRLAIEGFRDSIQNNLADNAWESDKQRILKIVGAGQARGISKAELTRKTQWCKDKKIRDAYIDDMAEAGTLVVGRKDGVRWLWKAPHGYDQIGGDE